MVNLQIFLKVLTSVVELLKRFGALQLLENFTVDDDNRAFENFRSFEMF